MEFKNRLQTHMIKNIEKSNWLDVIKWKSIDFMILFLQHAAIKSEFFYYSFIFLVNLFQLIIYIKVPFLSSETFRSRILLILGQNWHQLLEIEEWVVDSMVIFGCSMTFIIILLSKNKSNTKWVMSFVSVLYSLYLLFFTSLNTLAAQNIQLALGLVKINNGQELQLFEQVLKVTVFLLIIITDLLFFFFVFYSFEPLRRHKVYWKLSCYPEFLKFCLHAIRCYLFTWGELSLLVILLSLTAEIQILQFESRQYSHKATKTSILIKISKYWTVTTHFPVIIYLLNGDKLLSTKAFILGTILVLIYWLIVFHKFQKCQNILPICQNKVDMYSFYFANLQKLRKSEKSRIQGLLVIHKIYCSAQKCCFRDKQQEIEEEHCLTSFTKFYKNFFKSDRYSSPDDQIMYELWKFQTTRKVNIDVTTRCYSLENEFIVRCLHKISVENCEDIAQSEQQGQIDLQHPVVKHMENISTQYEKLYDELNKNKPKLSKITIQLQRISIVQKAIIEEVEGLYAEKKLDFFLIDIISQFSKIFKSSSTPQLERILSRVRMTSQQKDQVYMSRPCLYVSKETGKIEKFNKETFKFLRAKNFEVKNKNFVDFFEPKLSFKQFQLYLETNNDQEQNTLFFKRYFRNLRKKQQNRYKSAQFFIKTKFFNNSFFYEITLQEKQFQDKSIDLIVEKDSLKLIASCQNKFVIQEQNDSEPQIIDIEELYQTTLLEMIAQLPQKKKMIQRESKYLELSLHEKNYMKPSLRYFKLRIQVIGKQEKEDKIRKTVTIRNMFEFRYTEVEDYKLILKGSKHGQNEDLQSVNTIQKIQEEYFQRTLKDREFIDYSPGIKTYRLFSSELYNIDLEDKAAYENLFQKTQNFPNQRKIRFSMTCIKVATIIMLLCLLTTIILADRLFFRKVEAIPRLNQQAVLMQVFSLHTNRIISISRDISTGLYSNYQIDPSPQLSSELQIIQKLTKNQIFDVNSKYQVEIKGQRLKGNLNELYQVAFEMLAQMNGEESLKQMLELNRLMNEERARKHKEMEFYIDSAQSISFMFTGFFYIDTVLLLSIFIFLDSTYSQSICNRIRCLLLYSETKLNRLKQNIYYFKSYLVLTNKKMDFQIEEQVNVTQGLPERIKPKMLHMGPRAHRKYIIAGAIFLIILFVVLAFCFNYVKEILDKTRSKIEQERAIVDSYISLSEISNEIHFLQSFPSNLIEDLQNSLSILASSKFALAFSDPLNMEINQTIYSNACQYLSYKNWLPSDCSKTQPGFNIENPFELGIIFFLYNQYADLLRSKLEDTFAATGVFSGPFISIIEEIGQKCYDDTSAYSADTVSLIKNVLWFSVCLYVGLVMGYIALFYVSEKKIKTIGEIIFNQIEYENK